MAAQAKICEKDTNQPRNTTRVELSLGRWPSHQMFNDGALASIPADLLNGRAIAFITEISLLQLRNHVDLC